MLLGKLDLNKLGERLKMVDHFLVEILGVRLAHGGLSDYVAENKRKASEDGVFDKRRQEVEEQRINLMKKWAGEKGVDPNFAAAIMYHLISESCRTQDEVMIKRYKNKEKDIDENDPEAVYALQRRELLRLTLAVADSYDDDYAKNFFASEIYPRFEKQKLCQLIAEMEDKSLAVDLGCATGIISFELAPHFKKVIGYDISPKMIEVAKGKIFSGNEHVEFVSADLEAGLDLSPNSVSLAVMNMGTASDIRNIEKVIDDLKRWLKPTGKFFLSFYNSESLLAKIGFLPWPSQLAAHIDTERNCLEVHYGWEIYFLYARPRSIKEVEDLLSGLKVEKKYTFPTLASVLPGIILESDDDQGNRQRNQEVCKLIRQIDITLSVSEINCGTYIIVTGGK